MSKRFPFLLGREKSHIGGVYQYGSISVSFLESIYGGRFGAVSTKNHDSTFFRVFGIGNSKERIISLGCVRNPTHCGEKVNLFLEIIFSSSVKSFFLRLCLIFQNFVRSKKKWKYYKK